MPDVHTKEIRSFNMSQIRSKNTKPEMLVRKFFFSNGYRYRLHKKGLPGKPDLVFAKHKKVIFVNGCFWHGHQNCKYFVIPKTRTEWWLDKINTTKQKDEENIINLETEEWKVFTIWECELKPNKREKNLMKLLREFQST